MTNSLKPISNIDLQRNLLNGNIDYVEQHFARVSHHFETGSLDAMQLDTHSRALRLRRRDLQAPLEQWLAKYPHSYWAHYALGEFHVLVGWCARGTRVANETMELQMRTMDEHFQQALPYLQRAIAMSAHPFAALAAAIHLQQACGLDLEEDFTVLAEPHCAKSEPLCETRLWSLQPKWGGSSQAMDAFYRRAMDFEWPLVAHQALSDDYILKRADVAACEGDGSEALRLLTELAERSPKGKVWSALGYQHFARKEYPAAARCYRAATADLADPQDFSQLGFLLGLMDDPDGRRQAFEQAALLGDGEAAAALAFDLREHINQPEAAKAIEHWVELGVQQYSGEAMFQAGCRHFLGLGIPVDYVQAMQWWDRASEWGSKEATTNCTLIYWDGKHGQPQDYRKARHYAARGAQQGAPSCIAAYGRMLYAGQGGPVDYEAAIPYLESAMLADDERATATLIRALWYGHGVAVNRDTARALLERLQSLDPDEAKDVRGEIYGLWGRVRSLFAGKRGD